MKLTAADFDRQYAALEDDELIAMEPGELTEIARASFERELARRGLSLTGSSDPAEAATDEPAGLPVPKDEKLVEIAGYVTEQPARIARSVLESAGIPSVLSNEASARWTGAMDSIHLLVPASYEREARELLENLHDANAGIAETWLRETLPGHSIMIEDMLAEDDIVAARLTVDRTRQAFCFVRIAGGKVAETWHNFDQL